MLELLQQLLKQGRKLDVNEDEIVENVEDTYETIGVTDLASYTKGGEIQSDEVGVHDTATSDVVLPPFKWAPSGTKEARWNLFVWG